MKNTIDIDIQIVAKCTDPQVIIRTNRMTPDIDSIVHAIQNCIDTQYAMVTAYDGDTMVLLSQREIIRVFKENRKLIIQTDRGDFIAPKTLGEIESILNSTRFLRTSRSEIINLYKVSDFDFSLSGTIRVHFDNGTSTWVSRRYVRTIQNVLGLL
ncbi:MAG: LytTR family transcriptional regulator DNA-binding domain-containing protein [Oscillospiraceae bacterium]|nr:LytTR family transcriptional regulator DNA-binding domain-containing protein [Oscillospiraceae bacterium]MBR0342365.1 LytTR family transcriptional regulator DNA-binding domain-containing protein [Oscillospiraceae bacterium]